MKRGTRPFIVEIRRGQKRTTPIEGEEESSPLRNEALRRAEAALFGAPPAEPQTVKHEPAPPPPRRILASLAEPELPPAFVEEPERKRGRKPGKAPKPIEPRRARKSRSGESEARKVPLTPELISAALDKMEKATLAATPNSSHAHASSAAGEKVLRMRRTKPSSARRVEGKSKRDTAKAAPAATPARPATNAKRAQRPSQGAPVDAPPRSRPSIRGRYVFGTELKPGERWKRRLRRGR